MDRYTGYPGKREISYELAFFLYQSSEENGTGTGCRTAKAASMYVLKKFYMESYEGQNDFYSQFQERLNQAQKDLGISSGNLEEI